MKLTNLPNIFLKIFNCHCEKPRATWQSNANLTIHRLILTLTILFSLHASASQIISDEEVENTIKQLVRPIIIASGMSPDEVKFYIILDTQVNAFVYGGRNIFINTGLITLFNDPDVLKGVIAHELGHITGGHIARHEEQIKQLMPQFLFTNLLGVAAIASGAGEVGGAILSGSGHSLERSVLRYSRENESSADQAALHSLHKSHNSSAGLLKLLQYFQSERRQMERVDPYAQSHPVDTQRISAVRLSENHNDQFTSSAEEKRQYSLVVAKLRGFTEPVPEILKYNQKSLDPTARKYELAIALFRKPNLAAALANMDELIATQPGNSYFYELKGQMLFENGRIAESVSAYKKATELMPSANLIKLEYAVALIHDKSPSQKANLQQAISILQIVAAKQPDSPWIYRNLALAYGKLGDLARSNLMLAEAAILQNNYSEARKFIYNAKRHATKDPKMLLKIEDIQREIDADNQ